MLRYGQKVKEREKGEKGVSFMKGAVYNERTERERENEQNYQKGMGGRVKETDKHRRAKGQMRG